MIEQNQIILHDYKIIKQLSTYVVDGTTYNAEEGHHDDLVMCLIIFGWLSNQSFFKDMSETDVRNALVEGSSSLLDDDMTPFGWQDDGTDEEGSDFSVDPFYDMDIGTHRYIS